MSMRIGVLLLRNLMPLTIHRCLLVVSSLLWFSTSCLGSQYEDCLSSTIMCGDVEFGYPFGENGSGCGDPDFQLHSCDYQGHPLMNIGGSEYHIMESSFLANSSIQRILTIVNDNLWGGKCNLSGNYSQFWLPGSQFPIANGYTNLTLWKHCDQIPENAYGNLSLCGDNWHYSSSPRLNPEQTPFCTAYQLPINNLSTESINNQTLIGEGFQVTWRVDPNRSESCTACSNSHGSCGYRISKPTTFLCYCPNGTSYPDKCPINGIQDTRGRSISSIIIGCSVLGVALTVVAVVLLLMFYAKRRNPPTGSSTSTVEKFLREYGNEMPSRYSLSHLKKITNNFAERLGEGGYGVVYKGKFRSNEVLVAVKILDRHRHSEIQFMNEVTTIGRIHHVNLVRLLGYCFESPTSALVYEYMVNGSLDKFLFGEKEEVQVLRWEQLYSIALGAARGISYLHHDCENRIIHFDIKPHNILLDSDFTPKVSDFGLAKFCGKEETHISMTAGRGTPGYVAPELCDNDLGPVTDKSDVYSFGMLLLEIVGGRKNIDWRVSHSSQFYFPEWAFKMLESGELGMRLRGGMETELDEEKARRLTKVGLWCIQYNYVDRPSMSRVVQMLEEIGDDMPDPPLPSISVAAPEMPLLQWTEEGSSVRNRYSVSPYQYTL